MRTTDPAAIVVDDVTVRYGDVVALDGASLTLPGGHGVRVGRDERVRQVDAVQDDHGSGAARCGHRHRRRPGTTHGAPVGLDRVRPGPRTSTGSSRCRWRIVVMTGRYGQLGFTGGRAARTGRLSTTRWPVELTEYRHRQIDPALRRSAQTGICRRGIARGAASILLDEPFARCQPCTVPSPRGAAAAA